MKKVSRRIHARIPFGSVIESIPFLSSHGLGIEVTLSGTDIDGGAVATAEELGTLLRGAGIPVTLHAPFTDLFPGSPDERVREVARERMLQTATIAGALAPGHIVVHPAFDRWRNGRDVPFWLERSTPIWAEMAGALPAGVKILFENVFEENPSSIVALLDALPRGRFGFCFDTGHFNLFSTVTMDRWLRSVGERLEAFHLHDNGGLDDDHRPIGEGKINFSPIAEYLRDEMVLVLEHGGLDETLRSLKKLRDLL
jgi:sugar phosphate isomerase/epimerase